MTPADQFFALADATRCRVVEMLSSRPMPVHELTAAFSISRPAISRHLRVLKQARLVKEIKQGRENIYSLQREHLEPLQTWLGAQSSAKSAAGVSKKRVAKAASRGSEGSPKTTATKSRSRTAAVAPTRIPRQPPVQRGEPRSPAQAQLDLF